jgi:hypothetical protein
MSLACNAMRAHIELIERYGRSRATQPGRTNVLVHSLIAYGSILREALNILTGTNRQPGEMSRVLNLAARTDVPAALVKRVKRICGGSDPASRILTMMRNQLGYHWDPEVLKASLQGFVVNRTLVWAEAREFPPKTVVHRLALETSTNAMFPSTGRTDAEMRPTISTAMDAVQEAGNAISSLMTHAIRAYYDEIRVTPGRRGYKSRRDGKAK